MNSRRVVLWLMSVGILCLSMAVGQERHDHGASGKEKFGKVNFPISCNAAAQERFNRALAMLHSFMYEESGKAFSEISKTDPRCAMAYWGIAISQYHPLWTPPSAEELKIGAAAVEKAKAVGTKSQRERAYVEAIEAFYRDSQKLDHHTRAVAYEKAMEQIYLNYPKDHEAAIFYALSLLGTASPGDKTYANQKKAVEILNTILPVEPEHPGIVHYIIHSFDYPQLAPLALPAARVYAKIAPSSAHALHMPSHIFTRLGLWEESIQSNIASAAAAKEHVTKTHPRVASMEELHAMDYLMYAYLQGAEDEKAKRVLEQTVVMEEVDQQNFAAAYAFSAIPVRFALERRHWSQAAVLKVHPSTFPWNRFPYAEAIVHFGRAIGAARSGDLATARQDVESLASLQKTLADTKNSYWADQVEIQRRVSAAWLAYAEGKNEESLKLMRAAADLEDLTEKHPVTPGPIFPAHELLGDLLLELNQPSEALQEFERSLRDSPNRFNGLYGAARALQMMGNRVKARAYYEKLVSVCDRADGVRTELQKAKEFLASK